MMLEPKPGTSDATKDGPARRIVHVRHPAGAEAGDEARHAARPIKIVGHVLFARPDELDRLFELLGDDDGLADVSWMAPAGRAAAEHPMYRDPLVGHAGRDRRSCECGRGFLGRHPDCNAFRRDMSGAGLRLHSRMRQKRHRIFGVDTAARRRRALSGASPWPRPTCAVVAASPARTVCAIAALETCSLPRPSHSTRSTSMARFARHHEIGHHRNRIGHAHHAAHTGHAGDRSFIDRTQCAAEDRALRNGGVQHVRQPHVERHRLAVP